jgi:hypothetical protein
VSSSKLYFNPSLGRISAVDFNNLSDAQYKSDIQDVQNGLDLIAQMRPVNFKWNDTGERSYGLLAQDLQQIVPEAVSRNNGNLHVNYIQLISLLIDAIQTQNGRIEDLQTQLNKLLH